MGQMVLQQPAEMTPKELDLVRRTVAKDTNQEEFDLFMAVCRRVRLDPFRKQAFAVVYSKDNVAKRSMSIITAIGGLRAIADRSGKYRPDEEEPDITYDDVKKSDTNPAGIVKAVVTVYKFGPDRQWHPSKGRAYWEEFVPLTESPDDYRWEDTGETWADSGKPKRRKVKKEDASGDMTLDKSSFWYRMPHNQIAKCAEALALRQAWPEDLSDIYVTEEMDQANVIDLTATEEADAYQEERRLLATRTAGTIMFLWDVGEELEPVPLDQVADRILAYIHPSAGRPAGQIETWLDRNKHPMNEFWSRKKGDALEVKKAIEARLAALKAETSADQEEDDSIPEDQSTGPEQKDFDDGWPGPDVEGTAEG